MAVRIRMKKFGRKHRPFYRICAMEMRVPRDGKVLEELGTYDPMVSDVDARVTLDTERVDHWLRNGATPSDNVRVFIKKYGTGGTHVEKMQAARERLAMPKVVPPAPEPVYVAGAAPAAKAEASSGESTEAADEAAATAEPTEEAAAEQPAEAEAAATEDASAEESSGEDENAASE